MITDALVITALAYGIGSSLIPVLNAEAYVAAMGAVLGGFDVIAMVLAVSIGTVIGKVVLFRAARLGMDRAQRRPRRIREPGRVGQVITRTGEVLIGWLEDRLRAVVTVVVSAFAGIPPLLVVAVVAGVSSMRSSVFAMAVFVGRAGRFGLIAGAAYGLV